MPYDLLMSPVQIARCNRALGGDRLSVTRITHRWPLCRPCEVDVVQLSREGIREVIAALRAHPESTDRYRDEDVLALSRDEMDLADIDLTLEQVLKDEEDPNMLFGICI